MTAPTGIAQACESCFSLASFDEVSHSNIDGTNFCCIGYANISPISDAIDMNLYIIPEIIIIFLDQIVSRF